MKNPCQAVRKVLSNIKVAGDGCWVWRGGTSGYGRGGGYGRIWHEGKARAVHRLMFLVFHGPIPDGKQIDHTCNNRCCCNPDHLEAVTQSENMRRAFERRSA
jgi:hypothetical protein